MSQINLFRIQDGREKSLRELLNSKYKNISSTVQNGFDFELLLQNSEDKQDVNWAWVFALFGKSVAKMCMMPKGILLLQKQSENSRLYAISFGGAHFHLDQFAERDFGLDFACRVHVKKTRLTASVNTNAKKNKTISSFKELDHIEINSGESYTKLKVSVDHGAMGGIIDEGIESGTSLKVRMNEDSFENVVKLIDYVEEVLKRRRMTKIPYFRLVKKQEDIDHLESKLKMDFTKEESTIALSEFDVIGVDEVFNRADSYTVLCGKASKNVTDLTWNKLKQFYAENGIDSTDVMFSTKIRFLVNGNCNVTKSLSSLIDYLNEDERALLVCGKWYRFNDDFMECLHNSLSELPVMYDSKYDLSAQVLEGFWKRMCEKHKADDQYAKMQEKDYVQAIKRRYYHEYAFNTMREEEGYELCDRKLATLKSGEKIEICDLRYADAIFSVKRGSGSAELSYLVTQSEAAIDLFENGSLPRDQRPARVVLWMILSRTEHIPLDRNVLEWDKLGMLLLKIRIDSWMKKARLAGMTPEIRINYEE